MARMLPAMRAVLEETPVRRSVAGILRRSEIGVSRLLDSTTVPALNDDDEERRERRRTMLNATTASSSGTIEESETLNKCLAVCNENKLNNENAWNISLIDTLSSLLDRHHKALNNFKIAGSSLEASSRVYSLRVDSIHCDVLRISAGLNVKKSARANTNDAESDGADSGVQTGGDGNTDGAETGSATTADDALGAANAAKKSKPKPKRARKYACMVTKNKESINAKLETVPMQDPVFGRLNTIGGSINSSNRLMNNVLPTIKGELSLNTKFQFFDATEAAAAADDCTKVRPIRRVLKNLSILEKIDLRPSHCGYIITDIPEDDDDDRSSPVRTSESSNCDNFVDGLEMAYDMNADCEPFDEPMPQTQIAIDLDDFGELNEDERAAISKCRLLHRRTVFIEDMRPIDATSRLEYSYRPLDRISQFWAGPSHWKFKRTTRNSQALNDDHETVAEGSTIVRGAVNQRRKRNNRNQKRARAKKLLKFGPLVQDESFICIEMESARRMRQNNIVPKKFKEGIKLKLPTDELYTPQMFLRYHLSGIQLPNNLLNPDGRSSDDDDDVDDLYGNHHDDNVEHIILHTSDAHHDSAIINTSGTAEGAAAANNELRTSALEDPNDANYFGSFADVMNEPADMNSTYLRLSTSYDGAPTQITKIVVPFARRAKVIDMKNLKRSCYKLITKSIPTPSTTATDEMAVNTQTNLVQESAGCTSFMKIYDELPTLLSPPMRESLTVSIAFYSILHLANEHELRLLQDQDLLDFKITSSKS